MSASETIAELPKLSRTERRQLAVAIFELEEEADLLRDCDRRADERFRMLDMTEEEDGKSSAATLSC
jgi:hypothetical protein